MSRYAARMIWSRSARYFARRAGETWRGFPAGGAVSALMAPRYANGVFSSGFPARSRPGRAAGPTTSWSGAGMPNEERKGSYAESREQQREFEGLVREED